MVILYIYSTCKRMKSRFYEHQLSLVAPMAVVATGDSAQRQAVEEQSIGTSAGVMGSKKESRAGKDG
jgi:hypothetical protein